MLCLQRCAGRGCVDSSRQKQVSSVGAWLRASAVSRLDDLVPKLPLAGFTYKCHQPS